MKLSFNRNRYTTCFCGRGCWLGECFDASLVALRFLAAAAPGEHEWMNRRANDFQQHYTDKKRHRFALWYFWLCLSELPFTLAAPLILRYKDRMLPWLTAKSAVMTGGQDRLLQPVLLCSLRNCLSRFPEYAHIKSFQPYINEEDGRLRFDMDGGLSNAKIG